jgi:acyl-CoA thioesterase-1
VWRKVAHYRGIPESESPWSLTLIPFLLQGVGGHDGFMEPGGIHPNPAGTRKVEALVMPALPPLLR